MAPRPEGPSWSLFVEYPQCDAVLREIAPPRDLQEAREALEIFDDQRLVIEDHLHGGGARSVVSVDQLFDGAFLRVVVPRRRIFVSLQGAEAPERAVAWFPGSEAEQIESAIVKACGLPLGTAVELLDGDAAVVISPTIPNDSVLKVAPVLTGHTGFVLSLCAVGDVLFSGSQDGSIIIWDLNNLQYIGALPGHRGFVKCLAATMARRLLFSGSQDKTVKVWSLETFAATKTLVGHTSEVNALVVLEGSDTLVSGSEDRSVRVWSLVALVPTACFDEVHAGGVFALSPLSEGLLSAGRDRCIKWWPAASSSPPLEACQALQPPHYDNVTGLAVGHRKGRFYSVSRDRSVRRWDTQRLESDLQLTSAHGDWLTSVALSQSEEVLFTGSKDSTVRVWDAELRSRDVLLGHSGPVSALLVMGRHLFSASHDRTVRVWRADQFEC